MVCIRVLRPLNYSRAILRKSFRNCVIVDTAAVFHVLIQSYVETVSRYYATLHQFECVIGWWRHI